MASMTLSYFAGVIQLALLIPAVARPIWVFCKTKSYLRLILSAWLWIFVWSVFVCAIAPGVLLTMGYKDAFKVFPEMIGVTGCGLAGWIMGLELALLVLTFNLLRSLFRFVRLRLGMALNSK